MTMNVRQANAFTELINTEEKSRAKWLATFGSALQPQQTVEDQTAIQVPYYPPQQAYHQASYGQSASAAAAVPLPLAASALYTQALRVSTPREVEGSTVLHPDGTAQKLLVRQVEVPVVRQVKVPVKTRQIVPVVVQKKVKTTKLVEVPTTKTVEEEYTEVIQKPSVRNKEIWVKKLVPERYLEPVSIKKSRKVQVPTTILKPVEDWELVEVTENKAVEVDGYRVDEVQDSKVVEVEEVVPLTAQGTLAGQPQVARMRDIGLVRGMHHSRRMGNEVFHSHDERIQHIDVDVPPSQPFNGFNSTASSNGHAPQGASARNRQSLRHSGALIASGPSSSSSSSLNSATSLSSEPSQEIHCGFQVRAGTDGISVVVSSVKRESAAEKGGLHLGDAVLYVNNRPARSVAEFKQNINQSRGPVLLTVKRRGNVKLQITIQRS